MIYSPFTSSITIKPTPRKRSVVKSFSYKQLDNTKDLDHAGIGKRIAITLIDLIVNLVIIWASQSIIQYSIEYNSILPQAIYFLAWFGFYTYLLVVFGVSPGCFLLRVKVVDETGNYLKFSTAIFRNLPYFISLVLHCIVILITLTELPVSSIPRTWTDLFITYNTYSPFFLQMLLVFQIFIVFDTLSTLFNAQRRALRDFLSDSYVINRTNYYRLFLNKAHNVGIYKKSEEELKKEQQREQEFKLLNHIMEIPEVMKEIQRVNEYKVSKIVARIEKKPIEGVSPYYEVIIRENAIVLFHFRVNPKSFRVDAKYKDDFISLTTWRKQQFNTNWVKAYFMFQ